MVSVRGAKQMSKDNFKPVYAQNNPEWRIRYHHSDLWELQEYRKLPEGVDRSREQPWITHNTSMSYNDAIRMLSTHNKLKA